MKFEDLSAEDQALVNTDFGEDMEKEAAARTQVASEMYDAGCQKAMEEINAIDDFIKTAAENEGKEEEEEEEELDEESEKAAADLAAVMERGYYDTLKQAGVENHDDENFYYLPAIEEKIAAAGAMAALRNFAAKGKAMAGKGKDMAGRGYNKTKDMAGKGYNKTKDMAGKGYDATKKYHAGAASDLKGKGAKSKLRGAAKLSPYAALAAGGGYMATKKD